MSNIVRDAERAARELLAQYGDKLPINVDAIAADLRIVVREVELEDDVSGMLAVSGERGLMHINATHHPNRRRFSQAHELAHFILHRSHSEVFVDAFHRDGESSKGTQPEEIQANAFAAELLMPEKVLREKLRERPLDIFDEDAVRQLAKQFGVSPQALTIRLTRLNLISV